MKVLKNMRQSGRGEKKMGRKWHKGMEEFARKCIEKEQVFAAESTDRCIRSVCGGFFYVHNNLILLISPFYYKLQHKSVTSC